MLQMYTVFLENMFTTSKKKKKNHPQENSNIKHSVVTILASKCMWNFIIYKLTSTDLQVEHFNKFPSLHIFFLPR